MLKHLFLTAALLLTLTAAGPSTYSFKIAKLHYGGGGDWYANKTSLPNLISFCNQTLKTNIAPDEATVELDAPELLTYPFVHMTGHGNVSFTDAEAKNLRRYSPHLNIAETVWRHLKGGWLQPQDYAQADDLAYATNRCLANFGNQLVITFSPFNAN